MKTQLRLDSELLQDYLSGNNCAFDTLQQRYEKVVYHQLLYRCKNKEDAKDLCQDTFMLFLIKLNALKPRTILHVRAYLLKIAYTRFYSFYYQKREVETSSIESLTNDKREFVLPSAYQKYDETNVIISLAPTHSADIIHLRIIQDLSFKQIAQLKRITVSNAVYRYQKGIGQLNRILTSRSAI